MTNLFFSPFMRGLRVIGVLGVIVASCVTTATALADSLSGPTKQRDSQVVAASTIAYLPLLSSGAQPLSCEVAGTSYATIPTYDAPDSRPDTQHADLNLALRGYSPTDGAHGLVDYGAYPPADPQAPQLAGLFADRRLPVFSQLYRVHDWDWSCNCQGSLIPYAGYPSIPFPVTLTGFASTRGETLHLPDRAGGEIDGEGYKALVIYASEDRLTLKYTREDDVVSGYTLHLEDVCVEPRLLALYREANRAGRLDLPALRPGQSVGRARGGEVRVAIRDTGTFMDPRSQRDWWQGY